MQVIYVLGIVRQSRTHLDAISSETQQSLITRRVEDMCRRDESKGITYKIAGWAIDLGVSADKTTPWDRPELGPWLNERYNEWDLAISWKLDRVCRSILDFARFIQWLDAHKKSYLCVDDPIDLSTPIGRAVAQILAILAELELNNIKARNKETRNTLNREGRWTGGRVPYGYRPVKTAEGWKLEVNREEAEVILWMIDQAHAGKPCSAIAAELNEKGVKTSLMRQQKGKEVVTREWSGSSVSNILRGRHLIGQREIGGRIVLGKDHKPIQYCQPLITVEEWNALQARLDEFSRQRVRNRRGASLMHKVGRCICGLPIHLTGSSKKNGRIGHYRCASISQRYQGRISFEKCNNPQIRTDILESIVIDALLSRFGELPRMEKVRHAGEDHTEELARLEENIATIRREKYAGFFEGSEEEYMETLKAWVERRKELLKQPVKPAGIEYRPTGQTVAEYWESLDREGQNRFLQEMRVVVTYDMTLGAPVVDIDYGDLEKIMKIAQGAVE